MYNTKYPDLQKIIKKSAKLNNDDNLNNSLIKEISNIYNEDIARELNFLVYYYGLNGKAQTLESIGSSQENKLTRERVRQIVDGTVKLLKKANNNVYEKAKTNFIMELAHQSEGAPDKDAFLRLEDILNNPFFNCFSKNIKGLISFLNDCGIRQIAYRKYYYFYLDESNRQIVTEKIQQKNKEIRRAQTIKKMEKKSKTVTYVPEHIRDHLLDFAHTKKINLNPLYENILHNFIKDKIYLNNDCVFPKTQSWKARKGKADWKQLGIYIEKELLDKIRDIIKKVKKEHDKNISLMSFICQAFVWHHENHQ